MKSKNVPVWSLAMIALLTFILTVQISGAETSEHKWEKVSFKTPVAFSSPQKVGLGRRGAGASAGERVGEGADGDHVGGGSQRHAGKHGE